MCTKLAWTTLLIFLGSAVLAAEGERQLKVIPARGIPAIESILIHQMKNGKRESVAEITSFDKAITLPGDGPYEVFAKPKSGNAIKIVDKLTLKAGETHELKLAELIGSLEVFGDNFPRADKIVLTDERDPGPGEKGHTAIQVANDYRVEMAAPPGFYSVWVVPANGARPQRVVDRVRVLAGKSARVGD